MFNMYNKFGQFIDGKWQQSENKETYDVNNPATEEIIGKASKASPLEPEITTSYKQPSDEPSAVSTNVNNPVPAGTTSPLKLKPNTVVAEVLTVNPASAAAPPFAPDTSTPSTLN